MSAKNDGGAAFPRMTERDGKRIFVGHDGMTLRDWYAGQALAGLSANPEFASTSDCKCAEWSYRQADAMLAEREKAQDA